MSFKGLAVAENCLGSKSVHVRKIKGTGKKVGVIRESEKFGVPKFVVQLYMFYFGCLDLDQGF